ncbi:MAG: HYR domain-containing protein, partial [Saprospiraceae bacterium]|nr:HYR domain-containing protein [Saprospiraceae bacterium]
MRSFTRVLLLILFCLPFAGSLSAAHIVGGGITYECLGPVNNGMHYRFTMKIYRDCFSSGAFFDTPASISTFSGSYSSNTLFDVIGAPLVSMDTLEINQPDCIENLPDLCLEEGTYVWERVLPVSDQSYFIVYQRCCRTNAINNIFVPGDVGATYYIEITPAAQQACNNSPVFNNFPPIVVCNNYPLLVDYSATDVEGDQLVYSFCSPFSGGGPLLNQPDLFSCFGAMPTPPCGPPFDEVPFITPLYTPTQPMGGNPVVSINAQTGIISGTPQMIGQYVVGVCIEEYRNGQLLSVTRRDFQFNVTDCKPQVTALVDYDDLAGPQQYIIRKCDGSTSVTIDNQSFPFDNIGNFEWTFNLNGNIIQNTTDFDLSLDFPGLGIYNGILILNEGLDCGDTAYIQVQLFAPASLDLGPDYSICQDTIIVLDAGPDFAGYLWQDGSTGQTFTATSIGVYYVEATDPCGNVLRDSVFVTGGTAPPIALNDVSICPGESVTLSATGFEMYAWSPGNGLDCTDCPTVIAQPTVTTTYSLLASTQSGCTSEALVTITVLPTPMQTYVIQFYPNQSVTIGGETYTQPTTVTIPVASTTGGCDSLNTYILELLPTTLNIECPPNVTVALPGNASTIAVDYDLPVVTTDCPGATPDAELTQGLPSGGEFSAGVNTVCYAAANTCDNQDSCCFTVTVTTLDIQCPPDLTVALPGNTGAVAVDYDLPTATTDCPGDMPDIQLTQGLASGGDFPAGVNTVCYEASTSCGNQDSCCFTVTVTTLDLQCPPDITVAAPNGANTIAVDYDAPTAMTNCPGDTPDIQLTQGSPSGGVFAAGLNTVCYAATTSCGNQDECCFTVMVTTLDIQCPANQTVELPVAAVTANVDYNDPTSTTNCPDPMVDLILLQGQASGSGFAVGVHEICYEGQNNCGNRDTCCFTITVLDPPPPCDIKTIGCMKFELLDIRLDSINQPRFRIRTTNFCDTEMDYVANELPPGIIAVTPLEGSIYTAPNTGNTYRVRNPNASPFYSLRYRSISPGLKNGESDIFEHRLTQQSFPNNYIHMYAKLKNGQSFEAYLNTFYCPVQPWEGNKPAEGADREALGTSLMQPAL